MRVIIKADYDELSQWAAEHVIECINKTKPSKEKPSKENPSSNKPSTDKPANDSSEQEA